MNKYYVIYVSKQGHFAVSNGESLRDYGLSDSRTVSRFYRHLRAVTGLRAYKGFKDGKYTNEVGNLKSAVILK